MAFGSSLPARIAQSTGTTYYVSPSGSNAADGLTPATAWQTFAKVITSLPANATCLALGGTYSSAQVDPTNTNSGTVSGVKTIQAAPGEIPVFPGYLRIDGLQYWRFKGITFAPGAIDTGVYLVTTTAHLEFEACIFQGNGAGSPRFGCVADPTTSDIQWWGCVFRDNGSAAGNAFAPIDHGLYMKGSNCVVANCIFWRNSAYGLHAYNGGPVNCFIVNNTMVENGQRGQATTAGNFSGGGMVLGADASTTPSSGNQIRNNILAFNTGWGFIQNVNAGSGNVLDRNVIFGNTLGAISTSVGVAPTVTNTFTTDPLFVSRATAASNLTAGLALSTGSPALNAAIEAYAPATDYLGNARV